jgi:hypothetical protein
MKNPSNGSRVFRNFENASKIALDCDYFDPSETKYLVSETLVRVPPLVYGLNKKKNRNTKVG